MGNPSLQNEGFFILLKTPSFLTTESQIFFTESTEEKLNTKPICLTRGHRVGELKNNPFKCYLGELCKTQCLCDPYF